VREAPPIIVIAGPTASGKTILALDVAEQVHGEIVSADSRQIYRGMDIGTAKPTPEEQKRVPHHLIDVVDPDEPYNAGIYARQARGVIEEVIQRGCLPLIVGGSGLYIRALLDGFFEGIEIDPAIREMLHQEVVERGVEELHAELARVDPTAAARIHTRDRLRILRALEVFRATREPISTFQTGDHKGLIKEYSVVYFGLNWPREEIYKRITVRVDRMLHKGLIEEVRGLLARGYPGNLKAFQTVGYLEIIENRDGRHSLDKAVELIKRNSRRYAKRQLTWFRHDSRIQWVDARVPDLCKMLVKQVLSVNLPTCNL
jgi:tRNA dimethylallyltransferase